MQTWFMVNMALWELFGLLTWWLILFLDAVDGAFDCGTPVPLSSTYLESFPQASETVISNFVPSAYFFGGAVKYVTNVDFEIFNEELCVDGNEFPEAIQVFDDGTNGDDIANDGIYTRSCIHFCNYAINFTDYWDFAYERYVSNTDARLIVVDPSLQGQIPSVDLPLPLHPGASFLATSHAAFFVDINNQYFPDWPFSLGENSDAPTGKSMAVAALLAIFGDVFDYLTLATYESNYAIEGAGIYKWQVWENQGGQQPFQPKGDVDTCQIALTGVPLTRILGVMTNSDTVSDVGNQLHELVHGVAGYEYNNNLDSARTGDGQHVPGSCTLDHSALQGPIWDWVLGYPEPIPMNYCRPDSFCIELPGDLLRLEPNPDCSTCPDSQLTECCTFRYVDALQTPEDMLQNPELFAMSPLLLYIAGLLSYEEIMELDEKDRTYYCMGSDTDGGCGIDDEDPERQPCVIPVDDTDRNAITSSFVSRFTFEDLVQANGGKRDPPLRAVPDLRHGALYIGRRIPSEAELTFYTMLWRHHEVEQEPWARTPLYGRRQLPLTTWLYTTQGLATLHTRLHGIPCGGGLQVLSCQSSEKPCDNNICGTNAYCVDFDSRPLCICNDGYVGDGTVCVLPSETVSYPQLPAHFLYANGGQYCFGNDWPNFVEENDLPDYPGGISPFKISDCSTIDCEVGEACIEGQCVPSMPSLSPTPPLSPDPTFSPTNTPNSMPTISPSLKPTSAPSLSPTLPLSPDLTSPPTNSPNSMPTISPSLKPTSAPSLSPNPPLSPNPTFAPTNTPNSMPSISPSLKPTSAPTGTPSNAQSSKQTSDAVDSSFIVNAFRALIEFLNGLFDFFRRLF